MRRLVGALGDHADRLGSAVYKSCASAQLIMGKRASRANGRTSWHDKHLCGMSMEWSRVQAKTFRKADPKMMTRLLGGAVDDVQQLLVLAAVMLSVQRIDLGLQPPYHRFQVRRRMNCCTS